MEPGGSNSPPPDRRPRVQFSTTRAVEDRILRALSHPLRLLHRSDADFFVLGATGNIYIVTLSTTPSCSCPDQTTPCKHMLFVYLRVLGVSFTDMCIRRRTIRPGHLLRLLGMPTSPAALAGARARERFHQLFLEAGRACGLPEVELEDGLMCPICMEEMGNGERVVACRVCHNRLHEECFQGWKRSRGRRVANCVICRARWRQRREEERYKNLAAYASEDDGLCVG